MSAPDIELLPCPFCGGKAGFVDVEANNKRKAMLGVECGTCGADIVTFPESYAPQPKQDILLGTAGAWNTRYKPVAGVEVRPLDDTQLTHDIGVWTMVPVRPTERMIEAGKSADDEFLAEPPGFYAAEEIYKAMIEAAPKAPFKPDLFSEPISLPAQEPVAWMGVDENGEERPFLREAPARVWANVGEAPGGSIRPLYASPQPDAAITEEVVDRALARSRGKDLNTLTNSAAMREILAAALKDGT